MVKLYTLSTCDTCRKAVKWLRARGVAFEEKAIRETPPSAAELRAMLRHRGGIVRALFNVSGQEYRAQKLGDRLPTLKEGEAIALLAANGSLVKRPFLIGADVGLVGFDEAEWDAQLPKVG